MNSENYFDEVITFDSLYKGLKKSCRNVRWKDSVIKYESNGLTNTHLLRKSLLDGTYKIKPYQRFIIHEPKEREIVATRIPDRQVQRAICDGGLYADLTEHFIYDSGACLKGKGTTWTLDRLETHLHKYYRKHGNNGWVLKCDIRHFFPSTRHDVAKAAVAKRVHDERAREYVFNVIDSFGGDKGIGLGSQISQLVEMAVLDDLDHFIKERLRAKHYVRYMDDFVLIHESKEYLKTCWGQIEAYLNSLGFELNKKTTMYPLEQGVRMLKWRFILTDTGKVIRQIEHRKVSKQRRKMRKLYAKELNGDVEPGTTKKSLDSWLANAEHGDTYKIREGMEKYYKELTENDRSIENGKSRSAVAGGAD